MITSTKSFSMVCCGLSISLLAGCASGPSFARRTTGSNLDSHVSCSTAGSQSPSSVHIERGRPNRVVDGIGWVWSIPDKVLLWDHRVNNHNVSEETTNTVAHYLENNGVDDVCVRVNQYDPKGEWRRLTENREVGAGWRYTFGTLSLVGYTLFPGRVFGGDRYNPYTNSLYVYSDVPSLAMQSAAYSKDVQSRKYPGTYAAVNELPLISLWHETVNTRDALAYIDQYGNYDDRVESLRILHPYYGARAGGAVGNVFGGAGVLEIGGALVGHVSGRVQANRLSPDQTASAPNAESQPTEVADYDSLSEKHSIKQVVARGQQQD